MKIHGWGEITLPQPRLQAFDSVQCLGALHLQRLTRGACRLGCWQKADAATSILYAGLVSSNRKTFPSWMMPNTSDLLVIKLTGLSSQTCGSRITRNHIEEFFSLHSAEIPNFILPFFYCRCSSVATHCLYRPKILGCFMGFR